MLTGTDPTVVSPFRLIFAGEDSSERSEMQRLLNIDEGNRYEFSEVETGAALVQLLRNTEQLRPDCVILRDTLPDMSAMEILAAVLTSDELPPCPFVVLTQNGCPHSGRDFLRAGAQDYIGREWITPQGLTRSIENAAERWALARKLIERNYKLIESEKQFRVIFASAAIGIARVELDGSFAVVNDAFCRIHGYSKDEMLTQTVQQVTHPEDLAADMAFMQELLNGGRTNYTLEKRKIRKDGVTIWANHSVSLDRHSDGTPYQFISAVHDISDRKHAEEELFAANSRLQALMNALPVGVSFSDDKSCQRVTGNREVLAQFASSASDNLSASAADPGAPGRQVQFFSEGRRIDNSELPLQRAVVEDRTIPAIDLEILMPDGRMWYAEASGAPIHDDCGEVVAGVAVTVDVTARRLAEIRLRQFEERRRLILEAASMGTFEVDLLTGEGEWNGMEFGLLGLREGDVRPSPEAFFQHVHPEDIQNLRKEWDDAVQSGNLDAEFRIVLADGSVRWLAGKGSFLYATENADVSGPADQPANTFGPDAIEAKMKNASAKRRPTRFLGVNYDITKVKDAEDRIRKLNAELEDRVLLRTAQLESANKELEAFTYSVSHDMRAPVRAIDGFSRILQDEYITKISPEAADCLTEVARNARYMGRLIDDLLNFSRLGRQAIRMEHFSPETLVTQCLGEQTISDAAEIRLLQLSSCCGDSFLLKQVWLNLLNNAVKYSGNTAQPVIEIGSGSYEKEVIYYVKDNGVGFDMRYAHKLFGVFQRLHRQEDYEGTGVGLAIVQRIIHRHGGRVWAESVPGAGATFYFSLPLEGAFE